MTETETEADVSEVAEDKSDEADDSDGTGEVVSLDAFRNKK